MMIVAEDIRNLKSYVELLAPAGRWEALVAVLDAGADAVYLSGKQFNMRRHRGDFHFTNEQLADATSLVHQQGRRLYVTLNAMLGQDEVPALRKFMWHLDALEVDALIVQDLATLAIARQLNLRCDLHASVMMNVHHWEHAAALKELGVSRVIASRDIHLSDMAQIADQAKIEVECFVHGDMCVAHSGQCSMSGALLGKSANRGECMKPCRWDYELVRLDTGEPVGRNSTGQLLSIKDLSLIRHLPEMIQAGVCSLKIEGRMRDADYLHHLVACYRQVIDAYYHYPAGHALEAPLIEKVYRNKVRLLSTLTVLGGSSDRSMIDTTGNRETIQLSNGCVEPTLAEQTDDLFDATYDDPAIAAQASQIELAVCVDSAEAADAAIDGGAHRIDIAAELSQLNSKPWAPDQVRDLIERAHAKDVQVALRTPRVTTRREWAETTWLLNHIVGLGIDRIVVHHLGALRVVKQLCPQINVTADYGFNLLNSEAAGLLAFLGVHQGTLSVEGGLPDLVALAKQTTLPLEVMVHGPIDGMLVDHCMIALHVAGAGRKDVCRGPCRHVAFGLRDQRGQVRPIIADQHCRNHLMTGHDLAIWPTLEACLLPNIATLRIEAQFYPTDLVHDLTQVYRSRLDELASQTRIAKHTTKQWESVQQSSPRPLNLGPFARSIVHTRTTPTVARELASVS